MKLYAVMFCLDNDMNPADMCLCNTEGSEDAIFQNREAAEQELANQLIINPDRPYVIFEMSNEILKGY